jgi:GNAT superfamily N-acetyltransferase
MHDLRAARWPDDLELVRALFREYASGLDFDLGFQDFERELETLPGDYAPPRGALFLAWTCGDAAGCVALRPLDAERVVAEARRLGYARMRLDTAPDMGPAIALYRALGFAPIPPYRFNPLPGALFFERAL